MSQQSGTSGASGASNTGSEQSGRSVGGKRVTFEDNCEEDEDDGRAVEGEYDDDDEDNEEGINEEYFHSCEEIEETGHDNRHEREETTNNQANREQTPTNRVPTSIKDHIEMILAQVEEEIKSAFQVNKKVVVQKLKTELEEELEKNFGEEDLCDKMERGLDAVEKLIGSLVLENEGDNVWKRLEGLKEDIEECFEGPNKLNEQKTRDNVAQIMNGIVELENDFGVYKQEEDKKAKLVALLVVLGETIDKLFSPDGEKHVPIETIKEKILEIQNAKTLFLTTELKSKRQSRLDRVKHRLKSLHADNTNEIVQTIFAELRESIKVSYLQDPMRPSANKRVRAQLNTLKANLADFVTDGDTRMSILEELNEIQEDIHRCNLEGIGKFIATQKETIEARLAAESNPKKSDKLRGDLSEDDFWTHIEQFLIESFNGSPSESAAVRDNSLNLYINNLHPKVTGETLKRQFSRFGEIVSTRVSLRANSVQIGFVRFERPGDAVRAMEEMDREWLNGRRMDVSVATNLENTKSHWRYLLGKAIQ